MTGRPAGRRAVRLLAAFVFAPSLVAGWLIAPACAPAPAASAAGTDRTIVLLSARAFDGSDRVARHLRSMADATDVLGPVRFAVREAPDGALDALPGALEGLADVRAVVALLGDLSVLDGLDPSIRDRGAGRLHSRVVRPGRVESAVAALERAAGRLDARLVLATAPVGMQGRVEVPELLQVAERLRARHDVLGLGGCFRALEPAPLFSNGIDRLDAYGHDELARALFVALCEDPGPVPPRNAAERAARTEARALLALAAGDFERFGLEAQTALRGSAPTARHAMRRAAIAAALRGPDAGAAEVDGVDAGTDGVPGLALWRALRDESHETAAPGDPFEAGLADAIRAITRSDPDCAGLADALVGAAPHRLEAWIVLHLALQRAPDAAHASADVRAEARTNLAHFPRTAVADRLTARLFHAWPATLTSLPAIYLASRPFDVLQPTGPILEAARRRAHFGYTTEAYHLMLNEMGDDRFPSTWIEARADWAPR